MPEPDQPSETERAPRKPLTQRLRQPFSWMLITFLVGQVVSFLFSQWNPALLARWNDALEQSVRKVDPWLQAREYWRSLSGQPQLQVSPSSDEGLSFAEMQRMMRENGYIGRGPQDGPSSISLDPYILKPGEKPDPAPPAQENWPSLGGGSAGGQSPQAPGIRRNPIQMIFGSLAYGIQTIIMSFTSVQTAIPALVGYGFGWWITHAVFARFIDRNGELNWWILVPGMIFFGACSLTVLKEVVLAATSFSRQLLGTGGGGLVAFATTASPLFWEFSKHVVQNRIEARIDAALAAGASAADAGSTPSRENESREKLEPGSPN